MDETPQVGSARRRVQVMAVVYTVATLVLGGLAILAVTYIVGGDTGYFVMLTVFGILSLLTGYWMYQYLRDLTAEPISVEGEVTRKWHKSNLLFFFLPSFYVRVEGKIFTIPRLDYASLLETDLVRIRCFPHSLTVELVERYDDSEKRFVPADVGAAG